MTRLCCKLCKDVDSLFITESWDTTLISPLTTRNLRQREVSDLSKVVKLIEYRGGFTQDFILLITVLSLASPTIKVIQLMIKN